MKIKTVYIYIIGFVIVVAALLIFTNTSKDEEISGSGDMAGKQMPQDEIHKNLQQNGGMPGKDNLSENYKKTLEELKMAVESNPDDTLALRKYADFLTAAHQPEKAIEHYQKILKVDSKRPDILLALSIAYYNEKQFAKAEMLTRRILELNENDLQARYNLGAIKVAQGDKNEARKIWGELAQSHPDSEAGKLAAQSLRQL